MVIYLWNINAIDNNLYCLDDVPWIVRRMLPWSCGSLYISIPIMQLVCIPSAWYFWGYLYVAMHMWVHTFCSPMYIYLFVAAWVNILYMHYSYHAYIRISNLSNRCKSNYTPMSNDLHLLYRWSSYVESLMPLESCEWIVQVPREFQNFQDHLNTTLLDRKNLDRTSYTSTTLLKSNMDAPSRVSL